MDALTLNWVLFATIIVTNAVNVLAGAFWGRQVIKAKDAQLENLRELTPMRLQEYAKATASLLGEEIDELKEQLKEAKEEFQAAEEKVTSLEKAEAERQAGIEELLEGIRTELEGARIELQERLDTVKDLDDRQAEAEKDQDAAERLSRPGMRFTRLMDQSGVVRSIMDPRDILRAQQEHEQSYWEKEGESS